MFFDKNKEYKNKRKGEGMKTFKALVILFLFFVTTSVLAQKDVVPITITNSSYHDLCAEYDSVNVALIGNVSNFSIIATHPIYQVTDYTSEEDWTNCSTNNTKTDYSFVPFSYPYWLKIYDNGVDYFRVNRQPLSWRPYGMTVTIDGVDYGDSGTNIQYIQIGRSTPNKDGRPQFFVLYSDGNIRLIPFPPLGRESVCFGSSVIVGPASVCKRPFADIASVDYRTESRTLFVVYRSGGTALLDVSTVTRTNAVIKVTVNYPTEKPFCTFRSMFVSGGNSDCDSIWWKGTNGVTKNSSIFLSSGTVGVEWFFYRQMKSKHNQSSPDIRVVLD